ncbi:Tfp pilus assembly protein PilV-like protein [Ectothiorhodospira sp. PHS-1]|uniref:type IV pilus modification protein PilV n=1 Tax=Ectothiorhodospira sp. PHS-1 TaxID=519989 RepID=UPI00024A8ACB|nr:type IV pilus modification protein PilV [Ectothiorhodospira sp. PHS-1]EHQ53729.1 Tfp pilus assembly protein PilV-like protein [Ectothiorhodospira sp. PHS-1]
MKHQTGVSLIEVLIAVLVISIGLLGVAGLQAVSVQLNQNAYLRSQATHLAYEISDTVRARGGVNATDRDDWIQRVNQALPVPAGAQPSVTLANGVITVIICWEERNLEADPPNVPAECGDDLMGFSFTARL